MKEKILTGIALITSFVFFISVFFLVIQSIGVDNTNKATIMSGVLSMIGGLVGAFSAYLIARTQITKQLDLQDRKDRNRIFAEMKIEKAEAMLEILNINLFLFNQIKQNWNLFVDEINKNANGKEDLEIDYDALMNKELGNKIYTLNHEFFSGISEINKYRPHFVELVNGFEESQSFYRSVSNDLRVNIESVEGKVFGDELPGFMFDDQVSKRMTYKLFIELYNMDVVNLDTRLVKVFIFLKRQIEEVEIEINRILEEFIK